MNENLDLVEILKDCPEGTPLYSMAHGLVKLHDVANEMIAVYFGEGSTIVYFSNNGHLGNNTDGECLLWPSKDCRDWSQFKQPQQTRFSKGDHILWRGEDGEFLGLFAEYGASGKSCQVVLFRGERSSLFNVNANDLTKLEKFDPKLLKTGDAVLVRDCNIVSDWMYSTFSHITFEEGKPYFIASCSSWELCVPYNQETEGLIGTCDKAPKFYDLTKDYE